MAGNVEQVPADNDHVIVTGTVHQPVKLSHVVMQVTDSQEFH